MRLNDLTCQGIRPKKRRIILLFIFSAVFILSFLAVFYNDDYAGATSLFDKQTGLRNQIGKNAFGETSANPKDVRLVVADVVRVFLSFIGIILTVYVVLAGFKWMTANGNEDKVDEAKSQLAKAFIGLLIILMAWGITEFVTNCLVDVAGTPDFKWYCPSGSESL